MLLTRFAHVLGLRERVLEAQEMVLTGRQRVLTALEMHLQSLRKLRKLHQNHLQLRRKMRKRRKNRLQDQENRAFRLKKLRWCYATTVSLGALEVRAKLFKHIM